MLQRLSDKKWNVYASHRQALHKHSTVLFVKKHRRDPNRVNGGRHRRMSRGSCGRMEGGSKKLQRNKRRKRNWKENDSIKHRNITLFFHHSVDVCKHLCQLHVCVAYCTESIIQKVTHNVWVPFPWSKSKQTSHRISDRTQSLRILSHYFHKTGILIYDKNKPRKQITLETCSWYIFCSLWCSSLFSISASD